MPSPTEYLPIRTVASLTGVNAITLRAWERRYGLIRPQRTPKGHRLYTRQHVDLIQRVLAMVARGVPIGRVREALEAAGPERTEAAGKGPWHDYLERMADAIARFDEAALDEVYDEALSLHPIEGVSRLLLVPLLVSLGLRWKKVSGGIAEEHFFAVYLRNKLGARLHHRKRLVTGWRLLAACAPGEHHEIGLLLFALAAHGAGLRVVLLGADTPLAEIAIAVRRAGCDAAVISSAVDPAPGLLERELPTLAAKARVPVFFGGSVSERHRPAINAAGAIALGTDLDAGVRHVVATLAKPGKKS